MSKITGLRMDRVFLDTRFRVRAAAGRQNLQGREGAYRGAAGWHLELRYSVVTPQSCHHSVPSRLVLASPCHAPCGHWWVPGERRSRLRDGADVDLFRRRDLRRGFGRGSDLRPAAVASPLAHASAPRGPRRGGAGAAARDISALCLGDHAAVTVHYVRTGRWLRQTGCRLPRDQQAPSAR